MYQTHAHLSVDPQVVWIVVLCQYQVVHNSFQLIKFLISDTFLNFSFFFCDSQLNLSILSFCHIWRIFILLNRLSVFVNYAIVNEGL